MGGARRAALVGAMALVAAGGEAGCSRRPHVGRGRDAGPAVVMVERQGPGPGSDVPLVDEKEPNDDTGHAQPLEYPKGIRGSIESRGAGARDVDCYRFVIGGEGKQVARVEAVALGEGAVVVEALDGEGVLLAAGEEASGGAKASVVANLTVEPGKTYFVVVRGRAQKDVATPAAGSPYRLVVRAAPLEAGEEEEPNDDLVHASTLASNRDETGYFGRPHDEDWLRLAPDVPDGGILRVELSTPEGVAAGVRLRDAAGAVLAESHGGKGQEVRLRNAPVPPGGALVLRAESGHNVDEKWTLRVAAETALAGAEREPNNTPATANPVEAQPGADAGGVAGFLWPGDVDVFRLRVGTGTVQVEVAPPEGVDVKVERLSEAGRVLQKVDAAGAGRSERLGPVNSWAGEVLVRVSARPHDTAFDAPYTLRFQLVAGDGGAAGP